LQHLGDAFDVFGGIVVAFCDVAQVEGVFGVEIQRMDAHLSVLTRAQCDVHGTIYRHGQHEAIVVVCMLADEVDSSRRTHNESWFFAVKSLEFSDDSFPCGHDASSCVCNAYPVNSADVLRLVPP